ncbi:MAG TPA: hypothetical protein VHZ73_06155 [Vicinamibacterales bacterium]|nr:hypothetical protein [Vicinamibacterales bacterium]
MALLFIPACGNSNNSPTTPTPSSSVAGTWTGALSVEGQAATMTWTLTETAGSSAVSGSMLVALSDGEVLLNGTVTGTYAAPQLTYTVTVGPGAIPLQPSCTGQITGTANETTTGTTTLSGSFSIVSSTCDSPIQTGPFTLTRSS